MGEISAKIFVIEEKDISMPKITKYILNAYMRFWEGTDVNGASDNFT